MEDEVHFKQYGSQCRMWIAKEEKDPILFHAPTRNKVGYFGAVRLRDGKFVYLKEEESFNGHSFFWFMKYMKAMSYAPGKRAVVILDNARYHHARRHKVWREKHAKRFALEFLPPYSPELNTSERIWKLTRRHAIHNRYFATLKEVIVAVENQFDQWARHKETLKRLCAFS